MKKDINSLSRFPESNIFHSPEIYKVYKKTSNYNPGLIIVRSDIGEIEGILLYRLQSYSRLLSYFTTRSIVVGGPLVRSSSHKSEVTRKIFEIYESRIPGNVLFTEIRNLWEDNNRQKVMKKLGYDSKEHINYIINLSVGQKNLWKNLNKKRRNGIRRSIREEVTIATNFDLDLVSTHYEIFKEVYRKAGIPLSDISLFSSAYSLLYKSKMLKCFSAISNSVIIGALWVLCYQDKMYNWYCASKPQFLNKYPNDYLVWKAMEWGSDNNYNVFDLGGAGNPHTEYGVRNFKKKFGGRTIHPNRFYKTHNKSTYLTTKFFYDIIRKIRSPSNPKK